MVLLGGDEWKNDYAADDDDDNDVNDCADMFVIHKI